MFWQRSTRIWLCKFKYYKKRIRVIGGNTMSWWIVEIRPSRSFASRSLKKVTFLPNTKTVVLKMNASKRISTILCKKTNKYSTNRKRLIVSTKSYIKGFRTRINVRMSFYLRSILIKDRSRTWIGIWSRWIQLSSRIIWRGKAWCRIIILWRMW